MNMAVQIKKTRAEQDYSDLFRELAAELPGNNKVAGVRQKAMEQFEQLGLPNRRVEEWKYTDLRSTITEALRPSSEDSGKIGDAELAGAYGAFAGLDCHRIVFVNGQYRTGSFSQGEGIEAHPLGALFSENPDWLEQHLGRAVSFPENDATMALNSAFMRDGAVIRISKQIEKPVHVIFVRYGENAGASTVRNIITLAEGAEATIVEHYVTVGNARFQTNTLTETFLGENTVLTHIKVQNENVESTHLSSWTVQIAGNARYLPFHLTAGAGLSRDQLFVRFDGEHAALNFGAVYLGRGKQHGDTTLVVDHAVPHCESRELYKGVMDDSSRGVFQGKLMVRQIAQKTDGKQMAQALLLSEEAEFDAKPELEIFADDVICGHGATSGQIDEDLLFYLRARGIPEDQARSLLVQAFTGEALELVANETVRECLSEVVAGWLARRSGGE